MSILPQSYLPRDCTFTPSDWRALAAHWYPVAYSQEVTDKPVAVTLLDERLVVYRTPNGVTVARDLCIHRGAPLSMGQVEGEEIICAYHGFRYDRSGACTRVPAQPDRAIPKKLCLTVFQTVERYGLIWTCLTPEAQQPIPTWPILEDDKLMHLTLDAITWEASAPRQVENFNDVAHLSWLHTSSFGNPDKPEVHDYEVFPLDHGFGFDVPYEFVAEKMRGSAMKTDTILYQYRLTLPFYTFLTVNFTDGRHYYLFDIPSPISRTKTKVFFKVAQDYESDPEEARAFQEQVLNEDRPMVENQRPEEIPLDLTEEFHIRADRFSTHYRRALKAMGLGKPFTS